MNYYNGGTVQVEYCLYFRYRNWVTQAV